MPSPLTRRLVLSLAVAAWALAPTGVWASCDVDPTPCRGCGCKGGPGWRHLAGGRCVGFRELAAKCGTPPSDLLCTFENAPGTGANSECALAPAVPPAHRPAPAAAVNAPQRPMSMPTTSSQRRVISALAAFCSSSVGNTAAP